MTKKLKPTCRHIQEDDVPAIVHVELERYAELYSENPKSKESIAELFRQRMMKAGSWMWVSEIKGEVVGFLSAMPTNKHPDHFVSWEETTDFGTLEGSYDESGRNVYVVNLDVLRTATKLNGQYVLMAELAAKVISKNKDLVYFESRLPMFRDWVDEKITLHEWHKLSAKKQHDLAIEYSKLKVEKNGKKVHYDRLLRFYAESGFVIDRIVPNAFRDSESLHFGAVCLAKNPLPAFARIWPLRMLIGWILGGLGHHPELLEKFIR
jgi:hypothetical protein